MNINIDLGNLWEMLSAVGTVGAVILSLVLALREKNRHITVLITTEQYSGHSYIITLCKSPMDAFLLEDIGYERFGLKKSLKAKFDNGFEILDSNEVAKAQKQFPFSFSNDNLIKIGLWDWEYKNLINKKIKFYVRDNNGKYHKSNKFKILDVSKKDQL
ncbi:hypothetical protein ACQ63C_000569 [Enterococcus hirae]|uniref:hypothetical protein n=1 Tax=Enterococcus hirae TaxID=1354 RepID=UPI0015F29B9B|nr:hypothetical protein [Enterococcus hirae]MBA5279097.1 hypothetical protein [Enterococcus hirae]